MQIMANSSEDESLDFLSAKFDPLKVLTASPSEIQLPCPDVHPCDNLQMYSAVLQGKRKVYDGPKVDADMSREKRDTQVGVASDGPSKRSEPQGQPRKQEPRYYSKSVVEYMRRPNLGPLQLLQDCFLSRASVRVWIRHCVGVRGVCEGVVLAFDKHMNIVIGNVTEYYSPFRTLTNGGVDVARKKKKKKSKKNIKSKTEGSLQTNICPSIMGDSHVTTMSSHVTSTSHVIKSCYVMIQDRDSRHSRFVKKLFIRGDNVVLISLAQGTTEHYSEQ